MGAGKLRVGLIGAGAIGRIHAEHLASRAPGAELAAIADVDVDAARAIAERCDVRSVYGGYTDHRLQRMQALGPKERRRDIEKTYRLVESVIRRIIEGKTVIARVNGPAAAGGMILAIACDFIVASNRARFRLPEAAGGVAGPFSPILLLTRVMRARLSEILLLSREMDAITAMEIGLINQAVDESQLDQAVSRLIGELKRTSPQARMTFKKLIAATLPPFDIATASDAFLLGDASEGITAFLEKRKPRWLTH
jgi:enoyl-CoA hydratase/carnithine racemase